MPPENSAQINALMREAQQHLVAGRLAPARAALEKLISISPDIAVVHFNLADILLKLNEPKQALHHLDRAADLKPDEAAIWKKYGETLQWLAEPDKSTAFLAKAKKARIDRKLLMSLQEILRAKPAKSKTSIGTAPPNEVQRAIAYLRAGRNKEAAELASRLDKAHPGVAIIADLLAFAQAELGQAAEAERNFRRAIQLDPKYPETRANLGQFLLRQGRFDEAIAELRDALRLMPDMPAALTSLGTALHRRFRFREAIRFLRRALALDPSRISARLELGECLLADFKPAEAAEVIEPILDVDIPSGKARVIYGRSLADMQRNEEAEAEFDQALAIASKKLLAMTAKANLLQTTGRFDEAEVLLRDAIKLEPLFGKIYAQLLVTKKLAPGDPLIAEMERVYGDPDMTDEDRMHLGFALAKALEDTKAYDKVFTYLRPANDEMRRLHPYDIARHRASVEFRLNLFKDHDFSLPVAKHSDFAPIFVTGLPRSGTTLVEQIIASHSRVTGGGELGYAHAALNEAVIDLEKRDQKSFSVSNAQLADIGRQIETLMRAAVPDADLITDKGVTTYEMIGPIRAIFPHSRIIVVRRDPRDMLLSTYKNVFRDGRHLYSNSLSDLAEYYHCFTEILDFWREKLPGSFHEIEYETLIADPETEARKLIAACGLEWEDQCLAFHENKRRVQTLSMHQVRQPLYSSSMKAWERYRDDLGELFEALGPPYLPKADV